MRSTLPCLAVSLFTLSAVAAEKELKESEVPPAVLKAVAAKYPQAPKKGFSLENEGGKTLYEVTLQTPAGKLEVSLSAEGKIVSEEQTIPVQDLPAAVKKGLASSAYGAGKLLKAEKVTQADSPGASSYELLVEASGKRREVVFAEDGKLLRE